MKMKIVSRYPRYPDIKEKIAIYPRGGGYASVGEMQKELRRRWGGERKHGTIYVQDLPNGSRCFDQTTGMEQDITLED